MRPVLAALALLTLVALACGDGSVIIIVNTGTVVSDPVCDHGNGSFNLQDQGGLLLVVLITSDTEIYDAAGMRGGCTDVIAGAHVQVRGEQHGEQVTARTVKVE